MIIAGAGAGKTTVITERIKWLISQKLAKPEEFLALTFTEKAAREMEERVDIALPYGYTQMWISTFHSFCDAILRDEALHIGLDPNFKLLTEAESIIFLRKHFFEFNLNYFRPAGNPYKFISGLLQHFSRLQDEDVSADAYLRYAQKSKIQNPKSKIIEEEIEKTLELAKAYQTYEKLKIKESVMDFADLISNTLTLFRTRPNILQQYQQKFKYILIDEYQDTNIAQNELVKLIASKNGNLTVVADDDQCLPPETLIATRLGQKKIKNIKTGEEILTAVGKGHIGISTVKKVMKRRKKCRLLTLKTQSGAKLTVTDNHKMFCYIPKRLDKEKDFYYVYLMQRKNLGWRLGVTNDLAVRLKLERSADNIIGLRAFKTESEARYFETLWSLKYQIPTVCFKARNGIVIKGEFLKKLYKKINTQLGAERLAKGLGVDLKSPHYTLDAVTRGRSKRIIINLYLCFRKYVSKENRYRKLLINPAILHYVSLETTNKNIITKLKENGIKIVRGRKKGSKARFHSANLEEAGKFAQKLADITGGFIETKFTLGKINLQNLPALVMPAGNVLTGHYIPIKRDFQIFYDKVIDIKEEFRDTLVYDLEINRTHNFIADGVVVHNSIYKWRGAAVSNILQFRQVYPQAKIVSLTKNYRSTQTILNRAYDLIRHNNPDRLEVKEKINKKLVSQRQKTGRPISFIQADRVENEADSVVKTIIALTKNGPMGAKYRYQDMAILVRANNHADPFIRALNRKGIPYQFLGPGQLLKQREVKDLIAYLKVLDDFTDSVSFYRLLSMDIFALFARDIAALLNFARYNNLSLFETCEFATNKISINSPGPRIGLDTKKKLAQIVSMIHRHLKLAQKETAGQILFYFLQDSGLLAQMAEVKSTQQERKAQNMAKFFDKIKSFEAENEDSSIATVVDWLTMKMEFGESPLAADIDWLDNNAVNILTVHSAKGLEFPVVFLVNLVNERFPTRSRKEPIPIPDDLIKEILPQGDSHLQEERRLFYVGMTRAKNRLFLTAANYYAESKRQKKLSPFVVEALGEKRLAAMKSFNHLAIKQLSFLDYQKPPEIQSTHCPLPTANYSIKYLSYSQIDTFKRCPLQYKYKNILKIPVKKSFAASFGSSIHNALHQFYRLAKNGEKVAEQTLTNLLRQNWSGEGYKSKQHEQQYFQKGKKYLSEFFRQSFNSHHLPMVLEHNFKIPFQQGFLLGGKIDRVDLLADDWLEIIDYKTSERIPEQKTIDTDLQMTVYALAASDRGIFNKAPSQLKLSFYYFEKQQKVSTQRTKQQLEQAKEEIIKTAERISKSDFKPTPSAPFPCNFCEYKMICEAWR